VSVWGRNGRDSSRSSRIGSAAWEGADPAWSDVSVRIENRVGVEIGAAGSALFLVVSGIAVAAWALVAPKDLRFTGALERIRVSAGGRLGRSRCLKERVADAWEAVVWEPVIDPGGASLAFEHASLVEDLQMVAYRRLGETEGLDEVACAGFGVWPGAQEAQNLKARRVGESLQGPREPPRVVARERSRRGQARAAVV
jgi:hypothetical protein